VKILASGDEHFDESSHRFEECVRIHMWMVDVAREHGVSLYICTGDVYERASTAAERKAVAEWLTAMADVCPVVVVKGNHDRRIDLEIMARLQTRHPITVVEDARVVYVAGAAVAAIAWPERGTLAAAFRGQSPAELDLTAQDMLRNVMRGLGQELDAFDGPRIGAGHLMIDGSVTSVGQPMVGHSMNVGLSDVALLNAPLVLAGHIHKAQSWNYGGCEIAYCGSPYRTTYGETEIKSVSLATYDGARLLAHEQIPTPCSQMFLGENEWGELENGTRGWLGPWEGLGGSAAETRGAEFRLRYRVSSDLRDEAAAAADYLQSELKALGAADVKLDPQVKPVGTARAPAVASARSISDKLRAYWKARGNEPPQTRADELISKARDLETADAI